MQTSWLATWFARGRRLSPSCARASATTSSPPTDASIAPPLAARVFADPALRRDLEAIIHPPVHAAIQDWFAALEAAGTHTAAMADIPLLYETGRQAEFDRVIVVACSVDHQIGRVVARDGISEEAARQRLGAQWATDKKTAQGGLRDLD